MPASGTVRRLSVVIDAQNNADRELDKVDQSADEAKDSLDETEKSATNLRYSFAALAGATAAVAGAMGVMTRSGAQIDTTLAMVEATSSATAEEMAAIRSEILQIGADMPVTMQDVADAFQQLSYAGFEAEESIAAAGAVTDVAIAGQMGIAESARLVSTNLRAFNMEARQAGAVASALAATFASSATTIQEMGQALEYLAPVASQAGQSIIEVSAAIGVLADNGVRASRAGTGLQQFFSNLVSPTGRANEALTQLGLTTEDFLDQHGDFKDMNEMLAILSAEMEDMPEGERLQVLIDLFGERGARSIAPLIDNVDELNRKIGQAAAADLETAIEDFQDLDADEMEAIDQQVAFDLDEDTTRDQILQQLVALGDEMSEEELSAQVQYAFGVDERTAEILAADISAGASWQELAEGMDTAVNEADLAAAQMATVGGQIEYFTGSVESAAYVVYTGFRPALKIALRILNSFLDIVNENEWALKLFGIALVGVLGVLTAMTASLGVALVQASLTSGALATLAATLGTTTMGMWAMTAASKAAAAANLLMFGSLGQIRMAAMAAIPTISGMSGILGILSSSLWAAGAAVKGFFVALGPVGWLILLISAAVAAYTTNLFGFRDAVNKLLSPLAWLWDVLVGVYDATRWVSSAFLYLGKLGIGALVWTILAPFRLLAWAITATIGAVKGLINWFDELPTLGKLVVGALFPPLAIMWALGEAFGVAREYGGKFLRFLGDLKSMAGGWWSALGLGIGDSIRDATDAVNTFLGPLRQAHDAITSIGDTISWLGDLIHDVFLNAEKQLADLPLLGRLFSGEGEFKTDVYSEQNLQPQEAGGGILSGMMTGVQQQDGTGLGSALGDAFATAEQWLPSSDAERGPFSNLTDRGRSILETLAQGAKQEDGQTIGSAIAQGISNPLGTVGQGTSDFLGWARSGLVPDLGIDGGGGGGGGGPPGGGGGSGGGGGGVTIKIDMTNNFQGDVHDADTITQQIRKALKNGQFSIIKKLEDDLDMALS